MQNNKIVYGWFHNGEIFYVGIGTRKRANRIQNRNPHCLNKRRKAEKEETFEIRILHQNLTQDVAKEIECNLIQRYGRIDLGTGVLTNMTDGGDGRTNYIVTDETKRRLREFNTGKKHKTETKEKVSLFQKGKITSENTKKKMSLSSPKSVKVKTPLGTFPSYNRAAKTHKCDHKKIQRMCKSSKYPEYQIL